MQPDATTWIDALFHWCVWALREGAKILGISYEEINVWLFVFILPGLLLLSLIVNLILLRKLRRQHDWLDDLK